MSETNNKTKQCRKCQKHKALSCFCNNRRMADGLSLKCRPCVSLEKKESYKRNRESVLLATRAYQAKNQDKIIAAHRRYYLANRVKINAATKAYQKTHKRTRSRAAKDNHNAWNRRWRAANLDQSRAYARLAVRNWCKANPEKARATHRKSAKKQRTLFPERIRAQQKRAYDRRRLVVPIEQLRAEARKSAAKQAEQLSDGYVRHAIVKGTNLRASDIPPALVDFKRQQLRLHRAIKAVTQ